MAGTKGHSGGAREGAGQKPKPLPDKARRILVSLPPDLYRLVKAHGKHSQLIQRLLWTYFEESNRPPET